MPNTRKKIVKTVYKDDDDSDAEAAGDFSDSGSDAHIPDHSSSEEDDIESDASSGHEFHEKSKKKPPKARTVRKIKFAKEFVSKINKQTSPGSDSEQLEAAPTLFSIKDLTEADKLLPSVLNLSESDSSDDESPQLSRRKLNVPSVNIAQDKDSDSDTESKTEYKDVWSNNVQDNSEEIAKKTFLELEQHKSKIEETKASILSYSSKIKDKGILEVKDLLAQGEEILPQVIPVKKGRKARKAQDDSDSDMEDWEEVKEAKAIPQQGLQLIVDIPDLACRKSKKLDIEMMMKRKINRVKKEHQVFMHKVHVLCWIGHGNFVSRVLNDQEILAAVLSLVPSKECYPGQRVDMKYVEQITTWYKDKLTLKQDKHEDKYRPKAPPLKEILLGQIKSRMVTSKKYLVFIFVSMLRALGLQCRVMFNFVTVPLKPPSSELCSLSTKPKEDKATVCKGKQDEKKKAKSKIKVEASKHKSKEKIAQIDGNDNDSSFSDYLYDNIMQLDGNDDALTVKTRSVRTTRANKNKHTANENEDVSPPKRTRKSPSPRPVKSLPKPETGEQETISSQKRKRTRNTNQDGTESGASNNNSKSDNLKPPSPKPSQSRRRKVSKNDDLVANNKLKVEINDNDKSVIPSSVSPQKTRNTRKSGTSTVKQSKNKSQKDVNDSGSNVVSTNILNPPKSSITQKDQDEANTSKYFGVEKHTESLKTDSQSGRSNPTQSTSEKDDKQQVRNAKSRIKSSTPGNTVEKSKYFDDSNHKEKPVETKKQPRKTVKQTNKKEGLKDYERISHRDLIAKTKPKPKNDVTGDLVSIIKNRVKEAKAESSKNIVKGKNTIESDEDSDYLPEEVLKRKDSSSDDDFKPVKISPKSSTSRKQIDRRVLSSDEETPKNKIDVWCEVFVEELEQWIAVDVIKGKVHCVNDIYRRATNPVCYVLGWDNNNYLKDVTRRYVPHWNTVTRKQRVEPGWWDTAARPWLGPNTARDREENEQLNRLQLEAPLPKSIAEYKNHPLYALKRHLLKFEAIYPPDAATLGFVRNEAVYARECVYVCRSRDTWLKEAKVVRLGETPYKVVKARPKWDKLSNKLITDKPLEVFGPWQVQDYEPPVAENGIVPRNAYGNVELFKDCMLPKGTVHIKLPGLNRVAKKLNIDCAPAMTGFDFNGGWSHPVYDGFVVCEEFGEIVTDAWVKDQEEQERKELEKLEARVYGNWKRLIKGLLIRERLKNKYGFEEPHTSQGKNKAKGPRLVVKKTS